MQWYVFLIAILASVLVTWVTLEVLSRPIRALIDLRRKALQQIVTFGSLSLPKPRETAVCSREIREYDQAITNVREAQRILHDLGSQLLAFSENEPAIRIAVGLFGLNIVAAGGTLIDLSESYSKPGADRARLRSEIREALVTSRLSGRNTLIEFQAKSMYVGDIGASM